MATKVKKQKYRPDSAMKMEQANFFTRWTSENTYLLDEQNKQLEVVELGKNAAYQAKHRALQLNAIPPWADLRAIEALFVEAARKGLQVDHIIPLKGNAVCGLHVRENLTLLTKPDNQKKGNRFNNNS